MKNEKIKYFLIPAVTFGVSQMAYSSEDKLVYKVEAGDTFSEIVEKFSKGSAKYNYKKTYELFKISNTNLKSLDSIHIHQNIFIPKEFNSKPKFENKREVAFISDFNLYKVKEGDNLFRILRKFYPKDSPKKILGRFLTLNPEIINKDMIYPTQKLRIPSSIHENGVIDLPQSQSRDIASINKVQSFEAEVLKLSPSENKTFTRLLRKIVDGRVWSSNQRTLKVISSLSSELELEHIQQKVDSFKDSEENFAKREFKKFLGQWLEVRKKSVTR